MSAGSKDLEACLLGREVNREAGRQDKGKARARQGQDKGTGRVKGARSFRDAWLRDAWL